MKKSFLLGLLLVFNLFISKEIIGCSFLTSVPLRFDSSEYVFIGEVTGIAGPIMVGNEPTFGLFVKVKETVYLPHTPQNLMEVYPYGVRPDCTPRVKPKSDVSEDFPVGSIVRVIGKSPKEFSVEGKSDNLKIEAWPFNGGSIERNDSGFPTTDATSVFDYSSCPIQKEQCRLVDFEVRKDLLRLNKETAEGNKVKILKRFVFCPAIQFSLMVRDSKIDPKTAKELLAEREEFVNKLREAFNQKK